MRPQKESQKDRDVRIKQLYDKLNTRQEDSLDLSSLIEGLKKINHPLQDDQGVLKEILRSADLDGDGRFVEFKTFMEKSEMHLFQLFQSIDRDRNGNLSMEEVEHALLQASVTVSKKNLQAFFKSVDTDNDGEITFEEWRDFLLFTPHSSLTINAVYAYYQATHMSSEGDITLSDKALHGMGDFIAGGIAGAVSRTCTAPLDRLKVYLISQTSSEKRISSTMKSRISKAVYVPSKNLLKAMIQIYREGGGMRSFFVGNGLNVVKIFPESAIKFGVFEASKRVLAQMEGLPRESLGDLSSLSGYLAGGLAGSVSQFAIYPSI
ncbi:Calcium-binding mitochondrial carrier SAL1 [Neolecta irregularis DAH-3]|uniref:Calcium-binding mitochondrial carrier SAL1 n=1 Tax=Neolecta irregularis (strain DAH-3) TaxID=1198029 RepID=A0A1U7LTI3_NEOID|nr:Calcium-binding mitochondrial carrier SAL1 [Neolecta irregularis DAH-3]|eukprot:OLL25939.1 Calcium-binding mitochondrial carrier SAL1 [Neolecta irregularis DAH-3]